MRYYICNSDKPLEPPWGRAVNMHTTEREAIDEANRMAIEQPSNLAWYVHAFPESSVIFRAKSVVTVESEYLNGPADQS